MKSIAYRWAMPVSMVALWLLLNDTLSVAQFAMGILLSTVLLAAARPLRPLKARPRRPLVAARLAKNVLIDMALSNISVGRLIWRRPRAGINPAFVEIPLDLQDPHGRAVLACIVTYTPGTLWAGLSEDGRILTLHIVDLKEGSDWVRTIKQRYERPLMEIFQ